MPQTGTLRLQAADDTGAPVPCRVHIKLADGACFVPADVADPQYSASSAPDLLLPGHYRRYLHLCHGVELQSVHLNHGAADLTVPAGELAIYLSRGHEFIPVTDRVEVRAGASLVKEYVLRRQADLPAAGWYGGDMHTHFSRWQPSDNHVWGRFLAAEGLQAVNNMVYKHGGVIEAPQYGYGPGGRHEIPDHHLGHPVIASGEEFRDDDLYGHMIAAGIDRLIEPVSVGEKLGRRENYPLFASVCDWAHDQGGLAGWAHGGTLIKLFESLPVEAALGKLDFVENVQFNMFLGCVFWYRLLNCGLKLACTGGSDFPFAADLLAPWYPNLGLDRTYVSVEDGFSYERWIAGIRRGRTFASNGPLLTFAVEGREPGSEVHLDESRDVVAVVGRAVSNFGLDCLELVVNGAVVKRVEGKGGQTQIECAERLRLEASGWIALRARGTVEPEEYGGVAPWNLYAHTSPVYVHRGGRPIRVGADLTAMADYVRILMERYRRSGVFASTRQRDELMENCRAALSYYEEGLASCHLQS